MSHPVDKLFKPYHKARELTDVDVVPAHSHLFWEMSHWEIKDTCLIWLPILVGHVYLSDTFRVSVAPKAGTKMTYA